MRPLTARQRKAMIRRQSKFAEEFSTVPAWPTPLREDLGDGLLVGSDPSTGKRAASMWLCRQVPLAATDDAQSVDGIEEAVAPLDRAFLELGALAAPPVKRRAVAKSSYREYQLLLVNVPRPFRAPIGCRLKAELDAGLADQVVYDRCLLLLVPLRPQFDFSAGLLDMVSTSAITVFTPEMPPAAYERDRRRVDHALNRAGLHTPTQRALQIADSWWSPSSVKGPQQVPHADHMHIFDTNRSKERARRMGFGHCEDWDLSMLPGHSELTMATVQSTNLDGLNPTSARLRWMTDLLRAGARAVSVRGFVEPGDITLAEVRKNRQRNRTDIAERRISGAGSHTNQDDHQAKLDDIEQLMSLEDMATTVDTSTLVAFDGHYPDIGHHVSKYTSTVAVAAMRDSQADALAEMRICSLARSNPNRMEWPSWVVSYSGATSISRGGDRPGDGALLGFTELDRQPVWISNEAHTVDDSYPYLTISAATRAGKTMALQWLSYQWAANHNRSGEHVPVVLVNFFEEKGDLSPVVERARRQYGAARTVPIDDITTSDGFLDPIRLFDDPREAVGFAVSQIQSIRPWQDSMLNMEVPLQQALQAGVERGGRCVGEALRLAYETNPDTGRPYGGGNLPPKMADELIEFVQHDDLARCLIGLTPHDTGGFKLEEGLTLIQCRSSKIQMPDPGDGGEPKLPQRVAMAFARALTFGLSMAMLHRQGVIVLDEAWYFMAVGRSELSRLGRVASGQEVLIVTASQMVADTLRAGLDQFASRTLLMHVKNETDARAGMVLGGLGRSVDDVDEVKLRRVRNRGQDRRSSGEDLDGVGETTVNPADTLKAIITQDRRVLRGAVAFHSDLHDNTPAVELVYPDSFTAIASTNPEDRRRAQAAETSAA